MVSPDAPLRTPNFYGRQTELDQLLKHFSGSAGRRLAVLWGLGSFGKTQLALQFQSLHYNRNVSRIWIDAKVLDSFTTFKDVTLDVLEYERAPALTSVKTTWALGSHSKLPLYQVKAQLEEESNNDWLMKVDGVEDLPTRYRLEQLLPQCDHGKIILTTTRSDLASIFGAYAVEVGEIDEASGVEMFLGIFPRRVFNDEGTQCTRLK
jgi:hypothetical protein